MGKKSIFSMAGAIILFLFLAGPAGAQTPVTSWPALKVQDKQFLLMIAREALNASLENRPSREATVDRQLHAARPMVLSLYVDGQLRARAWNLKNLSPVFLAARNLVPMALNPKAHYEPLSREEMFRAKIGIAVLGRYMRAKDDTEIPPRSAVIIYNGFTESLALPGDVPGGKAADILSFACSQAGLRPQVWLLPNTTIFHTPAEEMRE